MAVNFLDSMTEGEVELRLRGALLVYNCRAGVLVTSHDVDTPDGEAPTLLGGHPLTREQADTLARTLLEYAPTRTVLPPQVVCWDGARLAWWTPAQRRRIWFDRREKPGLQHVSRREVQHPPLLWVVEARRLHLFALGANERPDAASPLFQAPYLNTYADGWVCGEFDWPATVSPEAIPDWEARFFDSSGTKVWASRLTAYPGGHDALWPAMLEADTFPLETLVPLQLTVLDAINQERRRSYTESAPAEQIVPMDALNGGVR
jgi:PRTRC genetic system protein B